MSGSEIEDLAARLMQGERRALARAITLVESTRKDHRDQAACLFQRIGDAGSVGKNAALRVGLSGTPGVGKSTFIEALGMMLVDKGLKVAVLAVDPSSSRSGGSVLGDKTRMELLSRHPNAFIRPSPSQSELGGVARRTREAIRLMEAAGFDLVLVETVGVGQSETMVAEMTDIFTLLIAPAGGDELQGVKRGIMEIADLIVVNKADGALAPVARATMSDYSGALHLLRKRDGDPKGFPKALTASAVTGDGLAEVWAAIIELDTWRRENGYHAARRAAQSRLWLTRALERGAVDMVKRDPVVAATFPRLEAEVAEGRLSAEAAADQLLSAFSRDGE
ncbi:methylmalonyl Co-A mutase-associated GTPase MeaB [Rhodobacteraceae bacterium NNCM2]|nr:methylmalonyl Co-A mutase-associated GTPase MeaB [Coraliihabitans acroporae]